MAVHLKPHQREAVEKLGNGKILYGGTGVGKSIAAMAYFFTKVCGGDIGNWSSVTTPKDVYVITTAKKRDDHDWEEEAHKFGIGKERDASIGGIKLTVDSWNNIGKYTGVHNAFFIFDEQRLVGSGAWTKAFIHIAKSNEWIMLSATPGDTWLDYIPVFIANGFYKNRTEFKQRHVVYNTFSKYPKVDRYLETGVLVRFRNSLLVHMPYERHTIRHEQQIKVSYDESLFEKVVEKRWHVYDMRPIRDVAEAFSVMRKVVNSDSSRLAAVMKLMNRHPRLIVFYNFDYELENLRKLNNLEELENELCESKKRLEQSSGMRFSETSRKLGQKQIPITATETRYSETNQSESSRSTERRGPQSSDSTEGSSKSSTTSTSTRSYGSRSAPSTQSGGSTTARKLNNLEELENELWMNLNTTSSTETRSERMRDPHSLRKRNTKSKQSSGMRFSETSSDETRKPLNERQLADSIATKSDGSERFLLEDVSSDPWEYLLSPEGMRANGQKICRRSTNISRSGSSSTKTAAGESSTTQDGMNSDSGVPAGIFSIAEWNGHKHEPIPKTERWVYLVQYAAGAEGWNCVETDAMVFYSPTYSYKHDHQAHGRIDRLNTPYTDLYYYRLLSDSLIDQAIMRSLRQKRSFNESSLHLFEDKKQGWDWNSELEA